MQANVDGKCSKRSVFSTQLLNSYLNQGIRKTEGKFLEQSQAGETSESVGGGYGGIVWGGREESTSSLSSLEFEMLGESAEKTNANLPPNPSRNAP